MEIIFKGRQTDVATRFRDQATAKLLKLEKLTHAPVYALTLGHPGPDLDQREYRLRCDLLRAHGQLVPHQPQRRADPGRLRGPAPIGEPGPGVCAVVVVGLLTFTSTLRSRYVAICD